MILREMMRDPEWSLIYLRGGLEMGRLRLTLLEQWTRNQPTPEGPQPLRSSLSLSLLGLGPGILGWGVDAHK